MNDQDKILILELSVENSHYFNLIAKLQAENSKLRECVEFYAMRKNDDPHNFWHNGRAIECLKELEDK